MNQPANDDVDPVGSGTSLDVEGLDLQAARLLIDPDSGWALNYAAMATFAAVIAGLGMMMNSSPVVIGAMLVAPVMKPVLGVGFSCITDVPRRSVLRLVAILAVTTVGLVALGWLLATVIPSTTVRLSGEVLSRTAPDVRDLLVAMAAGAVGAFAIIRPKAADAIAGVAIAVALVPPPVAAGIALGSGAPTQAAGAIVLYATNLVAIILATVITVLGLRLIGERPFPVNRDRLVMSSAVAVVVALLIGIYLYSSFQQAVTEASTQRREASQAAAEARLQKQVSNRINAWIQASGQPNLTIVSIDIPNVEDDEIPTISIVLLGGADSYVPPLGDVQDQVSEVLDHETYLSVRLVAVADQVSSRVRIPTPEEVDPRIDAIRTALAQWTVDLTPGIRVIDVSIGSDDRLVASIATSQPLPPTGQLDQLLAAELGEVPTYDLLVSDLVSGPAAVATRAPTPPEPQATLVIDGRAAEVDSVCRTDGDPVGFEITSPSVDIVTRGSTMTINNGADSATTDEVDLQRSASNELSVLVAEFDPDQTGVGTVELTINTPASAFSPCG